MITKKFFAFFATAVVAVCAVAMFASCSGKSEKPANDDDGYVTVSSPLAGYTIIAEKTDGKSLGLKKGNDVILEPNSLFSYTKIEYDAALKGFKLYKSDTKFTLADMNGHVIREGEFDKITRDDDGAWYRLYVGNTVAVYSTKAKHSWGMYEECITENEFVFAKQNGKWGVMNLDESLYMEKQFDKVYIVNYKSAKDFNVFGLKGGSWSMYDAKGAEYDTSSAEIKQLLSCKKINVSVGILNITF